MGVLVAVSATSFKCTELLKYDDNSEVTSRVPVISTVMANTTNAITSIGGVGIFHYKIAARNPDGMVIYHGTDNSWYFGYSKLDPIVMVVGEHTALGGCMEANNVKGK